MLCQFTKEVVKLCPIIIDWCPWHLQYAKWLNILCCTTFKYLGNILCTNQHGFKKGLSCNTQLITVMHQIFEFVDDGKTVQIATFDFATAFNKDHIEH